MGVSKRPRVVVTIGALGHPLRHAALSLVCLVALCACAAATHTISAPTIAADSAWRLEHCAGRRCPWSEDTLVADDVSMRMETNAGTIAGMFHVIGQVSQPQCHLSATTSVPGIIRRNLRQGGGEMAKKTVQRRDAEPW